MPAALIVAGIGAAASAYGAHKQAKSQKEALNAQVGANREAMTRAEGQEAAKARMARSRWNDYSHRLELFYRNNPNAVKRYGYLPGYKEAWSQPIAGAPGAPGATGAPQGPVTLAGGRQVGGAEYDAYVKAREARRAGMPSAPAGGGTIGEITDPRRGVVV